MDERKKYSNFIFYGGDKTAGRNKPLMLDKAIEDIENFFLCEEEDALCKFLVNVIEKPLIENVLLRTEGNKIKAAKILGMNRNTLSEKVEKLGISMRHLKVFSERKEVRK